MNHPTSVIGLGVMGQRMLGNMSRFTGFDPLVAWDPDPAACARTVALYPNIRIAANAAEAITAADTRAVYIASPPLHHREHALAAFDANKAVWCEKPLGVDIADSEQLATHAQASKCVNIVNFSLASATAVEEIERRIASGEPGALAGVDIRMHFSQWPRAWQVDAANWLSYRADGGFTREVLSHWVYLTERLLGPATLESAHARYPGDELSETHVSAQLTAGGLPVTIMGSVGGVGPDIVEYTLWGENTSYQVQDWNRFFYTNEGEWNEGLRDIGDPREIGYERQLHNAAAAVAGQTHSMPDFAAALSVQKIIEAML